ncbi:transposase [Microvirga tunisiensis]|uniref:Transposase n=1 Tax=Pannonibacter tanglangensis TaxID=2750084 RepID=A0ABW9ZGW2_9HYPH|nr:transposase [Pannonibacter sp. XCT-34]
MRGDFLNATLFSSLSYARAGLTIWQADYDGSRPHSQLGWTRLVEFVSTLNPRRALALRYAKSSTPLSTTSPALQGRSNPKNELRTGQNLGQCQG